jgi:hypothetical protein
MSILDQAAVGVILGRFRDGGHTEPLAPGSVCKYLTESKGTGRYANYPFPAPDGRVGGSPYWLAERIPEIEAWARGRVGRGNGGGRPVKQE